MKDDIFDLVNEKIRKLSKGSVPYFGGGQDGKVLYIDLPKLDGKETMGDTLRIAEFFRTGQEIAEKYKAKLYGYVKNCAERTSDPNKMLLENNIKVGGDKITSRNDIERLCKAYVEMYPVLSAILKE